MGSRSLLRSDNLFGWIQTNHDPTGLSYWGIVFRFKIWRIYQFTCNFQVFSDAPFSVLSPHATLFTYIPWMVIWRSDILATVGMVGWVKLGLLVMLLAPSAYIPRFFCRFLCPMGALLEPFQKYKVFVTTFLKLSMIDWFSNSNSLFHYL